MTALALPFAGDDDARVAHLASPGDLEGFRSELRRLVAAGIPPEQVDWRIGSAMRPPHTAPPLRLPAVYGELAPQVLLHRDAGRFALLHRLAARLLAEPALRDDTLDPDRVHAARLAQQVRRDIHKMRAFVRFRTVHDTPDGPPLHVAWFEPDHHIVEANAGFFVRRFTAMRWAILTPEASLHWDGTQLEAGPGASKADAPPPDAGEALWLTYYRHVFNPARLKFAAMENEMPRRYWRNLPEAVLIAPLAAEAAARSSGMVAQPGTVPRRRIVPLRAADPAPPAPAGDRAGRWQAERTRASTCRDCPIGAHATQTVWGEGPLDARLMLVGEQPGDQEDLAGRPFVGPAGALLDEAFAALGWDRASVYVTNAVKHFKYEPRGRRRMHKSAAQREADACLHWLESEISAVRPRAIVALGGTAARQLLGHAVPVLSSRGRWLHRADGVPVLVTLHPAALLRGLSPGAALRGLVGRPPRALRSPRGPPPVAAGW
jgi:probable DNA metabolism protein